MTRITGTSARRVVPLREQIETARAGQADIADHHAGEIRADHLRRGFRRRMADHLEARQLQTLHARAPHQFVVFDIQHLQAVVQHGVFRLIHEPVVNGSGG